MSTTSHIQATGPGRVAVAAAIVATTIGLILSVPPQGGGAHRADGGSSWTPAGGCGSSGC
jgi:hypothetical protein